MLEDSEADLRYSHCCSDHPGSGKLAEERLREWWDKRVRLKMGKCDQYCTLQQRN